jgi:hypothetical protein
MSPQQVPLRSVPAGARLVVHELTGFDEQCVRDTTTATAIELLNRLVDVVPLGSWRAEGLTASDRDRLLAAVYCNTFGPRVEASPQCVRCGDPFDLTFTIDDLRATVDRAAAAAGVEALPDGSYRAESGVRFRLPTGEDELAVAGVPSAEAEHALFERCCLEGPPGVDSRSAIESVLEELSPVLEIDIATACPECGAAQSFQFNIQDYLLRAIEQERPRLLGEIHRIARAYGWGLEETLSLRRGDRRRLVDLIESERSQRRREA